MIPTNYAQADKFLGSRSVKNLPSIRSTKIVRNDNGISLYYHNTAVVTFCTDGRIVIDPNGYRSKTTKDRINAAVPFLRVYQRKFEWYFDWNGETNKFRDGMILRDGMIH
jgi:hypothetical protein